MRGWPRRAWTASGAVGSPAPLLVGPTLPRVRLVVVARTGKPQTCNTRFRRLGVRRASIPVTTVAHAAVFLALRASFGVRRHFLACGARANHRPFGHDASDRPGAALAGGAASLLEDRADDGPPIKVLSAAPCHLCPGLSFGNRKPQPPQTSPVFFCSSWWRGTQSLPLQWAQCGWRSNFGSGLGCNRS